MPGEANPAPRGSSLRNRPSGETVSTPAPAAPPPKAAPKPPAKTEPEAPTVEAFTAVSTQLTELQARETARTEKVKAKNDTRIAALPEAAAKALAPVAAAMDPEALSEWMDEHLPSLVAEAGRPAGTLAGGGKKVEEPIPDAARAEWEKYGKHLGQTVEDYAKAWKKRHKKA